MSSKFQWFTRQIKLKKKGKLLQTQKYSHLSNHSIQSNSIPKQMTVDTRGISPVSFFLRNKIVKGSMTLESAIVIPLFLFGVLMILSIIDILGTYINTEGKLHSMAREGAVYGYAADKALSGKEGDWIRLKLVYPVVPAIKGIGFQAVVLENHCNVHIFNGYSVGSGDNISQTEEYVYVTEQGEVYHKKRTCQFINISIQSVSGKDIFYKRNDEGKKFYPCPRCAQKLSKDDLKHVTLYVTDYGVKYHTRINCSDLKRTVKVIPISQVGGRRPCKKCGG